MDFSIPADTRSRLDDMKRFIVDEIEPLEPLLFTESFDDLERELAARRGEVKRRGWWAPSLPTELGGMGITLLEHGMVSEVLGASPLGHYTFGCQAPDAGNMEILHRYAGEALRERWLVPLTTGDIRSCFAMTEPELPGSNPVLLATTATTDGDDFVIDGHKWFATAAEGSAFAIVMAMTDPDARPHERASMILVPTDTPGFVMVRKLPVMGEEGAGFFSHSEVRFEACRVPRAHLIGPEGRGFAIAQERLGPGRIHHCMRWLGICRRAFDLMCRRAVSRTMAPGQTLADKEIVQAWIAESRAEIDAARALTLQTAWTIEQKGWREAREEISAIKFLVAGALQRVVDRALQVHGGLGMLDDTPLAFFFRHERAARIYDGADEVHKLALARRILRAYRTE